MKLLLDASALLAYLHQEPGMEPIAGRLAECGIFSVNWSEVMQKVLAKSIDTARVGELLRERELSIEPFTATQAEIAADLWSRISGLGLSLAERACLALAMDKSLPVLTADRTWEVGDVRPLGVEVRLIR